MVILLHENNTMLRRLAITDGLTGCRNRLAFEKKIEQLREIRRTCGVSMYLEVVPTVAPDEPTPCLAPSLAVMQFCCDTGTELDIDLYCV